MAMYVAGVDSSTQSCKVVIVDPVTGTVVREGRAAHPEGTEVDPQAWWDAFRTAAKAAGGLDDVASLSVGGQQHGMVCLDDQGTVIRDALLWNDVRSAEAATQLVTEHGAEWWADATGSVPVASLTVAKLRWLADNEPDNARRIAAICLPHDWLTWKISGSRDLHDLVTDRSDASGTGYLEREGKTDPHRPEYRYDILADALYLEESAARAIVLPRVCEPWEPVGHGDAAHGWGHVVLGPGCGDNAGAALGLNLAPGQAMLSLGTSGVVAGVSAQSVQDPSGLVTGFADATGHWLPLACTLNASRIIDAMACILGVDYERLSELALSVDDAGGVHLLPYFEGERTPNLPNATAELTGMTLANSRPEYIARAAFDGLFSLMRGALDAVRAVGVEITELAVVGGGAQSRGVRELAGEALGVPVVFPAAGEYVALGAARQAAHVLEDPDREW